MVDTTCVQLQPPTDWQAFERSVRQLFARTFDCPLAEMVGRDGQEQDGIDIIGRRPGPHRHALFVK